MGTLSPTIIAAAYSAVSQEEIIWKSNANSCRIWNDLPFQPEDYPCRQIEQGYLCTEPVVRIRRDNDKYFLTYKSKGLMVREEYNLPLTKPGYEHLLAKADGRIITKKRYVIPLEDDLKLELDIFEGDLARLSSQRLSFPMKRQPRGTSRPNGSEKM